MAYIPYNVSGEARGALQVEEVMAELQAMQLKLKRLKLWVLNLNDASGGGDGTALEGSPDFDVAATHGAGFRDTLAQIAARYDDFMDTTRTVSGDGGGTTAERVSRLARGE